MAAGNAKINVIVDGLRQVQALEKSLNNISRLSGKINQGISGAVPVKIEKTTAQLLEAKRASMIKTRNIGDQIERLGAQGLNVDKARAAIKRASLADSKGLLEVAKAQQESALNTLKTEKFITKEKNRQRQFGSIRGGGGGGGMNPRGNRAAFTSGAISGAFPLLFGQGIPGAVAGFAGGFIGTKVGGQMGGFAGGLVATAVLQQIQTAITAISDLGKALGPFTQNTEAVINSLGLQGSAQQAQLQLIEQVEGKTAAFNAAMKIMASRITQDGVDKLTNFGNNTRLLGEQFTIAITKLQAFAAGIANLVLRLTGLQNALKEREATRAVSDAAALGNTTARSLVERRESAEQLRGRGGDAKRKEDLLNQIKIEERIFAVQQAVSVEVDQLTSKSANLILQKQKELDLNKRIAELTKTGVNKELAKSIAEIEQIFDFEQKVLLTKQEQAKTAYKNAIINDSDKKTLADLFTNYQTISLELLKQNQSKSDAIRLQKELNETTDKYKVSLDEVKNVLANELTNAITGLIDGTRTLGESLASIAKSFGNMFLQAGMQNFVNNIIPTQAQGAYNRAGGFKAFQYGGVVNSPTLGIIGEGGEPEYVIPASKMSGAMARYSAGARGGAVIPGGSHAAGTSAGGFGNTVVQYTGPTLNFNGDQYVPKDAVPQIINAAAKQGASAGRSQALSTLKNSRSQRAALGL